MRYFDEMYQGDVVGMYNDYFNNKDLIYRYRPIDKVLDDKYRELEKQEIYLATNKELNDPLDGKMEYFYQGDSQSWKTLFTWYVRRTIEIILKERYKNHSIDDANTQTIINEIISSEGIKFFLEKTNDEKGFSRKHVVHSNLKRMLRILGYFIFWHVLYRLDLLYLSNNDNIEKLYRDCQRNKQYLDIMLRVYPISRLLMPQDDLTKETYKFYQYNYKSFLDKVEIDRVDSISNVMFEHISEIIDEMLSEDNFLPGYDTASFSQKYDNNMMWALYANRFNGVCFIFKKEQNENGKDGMTFILSEKKNVEFMEFKKVIYDRQNTNKASCNLLSVFANKIIATNNQELDEITYQASLHKSKEWSNEYEERLIKKHQYNSKNVILKYNFSSLNGILIGPNVSLFNQKRIIDIIEEKCVLFKRNNFPIFFYNPEDEFWKDCPLIINYYEH